MRRLSLAILMFVLVFSLILGGCTKSTPTSTPTQTPTTTPTQIPTTTPTQTPTTTPTETTTPAWEWPNSFSIMAHPAGSAYEQMVAVAAVLEKSTGMKVRIGTDEIAAQRNGPVRDGEADMCTAMSDDLTLQLQAEGTFATRDGGPWQVRVGWVRGVSATGPIVRGDSDIKTMDDIKPGVSISIMPGAGPRMAAVGFAAWAGLTEEEVDIVEFAGMEQAARAVVEGKVDVFPALSPTHAIAYELEGDPHGIRYLDMDAKKDPEAAARYLDLRPTKMFGFSPTPQEKLPESARGVSMTLSISFWAVAESADTELIYHLAKWLDENYDAYKDLHVSNPELKIDNFQNNLDSMMLPIHEGTIKYLKEKGMWTEVAEARQEYHVQLIEKYMDAYKAAIAEADKQGIEVNPDNADWMELWATFKKDLPPFSAKPL